jgi:carboxypeptidase family protein
MRALGLVRVVAVSAFFLLPCAAWAQSSITGIVRDSSGGVLPGVTVEAASPALIEGVRSGVTDAQGIYKVVDLRPGTYTVIFSLQGFRTLKRDGLNLPAEFAATLNVDMSVGALEETITVTGEAPVVDIKSSRAQTQFEKSTIEALPGAGRLTILSDIVPGATLTQEFNRGVGGTSDRTQTRYSVHGGPEAQPYVDGVNQQLPNSTQGVFVYNQLNIQEVVVETSGVGADRDSGGMQINMIPKDGGNQFSGIATAAYSGPKLAAQNITPELLARHLDPNRVGSLKKFRDTGEGIGGPIKRDKLWFFGAAREGVTQQFADGVYWNKAQQPQSYLYDPDKSRPAFTNDYQKDYSVRVTWQQSQKNRLAFSSSFQSNCNCVFNLLTGGRTTPEAAGEHHYYPNYNPSFSMTRTQSSRILIEAGFSAQNLDQNDTRAGGLSGTDQGSDKIIRVTDQGLNLSYGAPTATRSVPRRQYQERFAFSYITGEHSFKVGTTLRRTSQGSETGDTQNKYLNGPGISYRFNNGTPNQLTLFDAPWAFRETLWDVSLYAQDQWSITRRMTLNLGVRFNDINASTPEQVLAAGFFVPERRLPAMNHIPHYQNLNPRLGVAYDLFGNGKTALKASLGQYPEIIKVATGNPANNLSRQANRTWNDSLFGVADPRTRNYVPDCDLLNPAANGECGPWSDLNFGKQTAGTKYSPNALTGFNQQYQNWQASVSLQHELRPGFGINVGYYRTWYGGRCGGSGLTNTVTCLLVTDNLRVTPSDYDSYCITAPTDSRLPNSGQQLCGLYDVRPSLFGQFDNLARPASDVGGKLTRVYNGFDATVNARFLSRGQISGGLSAGRTVTNNCLVVDSPQDARPGFCKVTPPWSAGTQFKMMVIYPLPWDISTSAVYQNSSGIPITASYVVNNAAIAPALNRNLSDCAVGAATCNATRTIELIPPSSLFEPRLQQVDLRFSRVFGLGGTRRIRPSLDVYNLLNASNVINMNTTYGSSWKDAIQILSGRLLRVGAQFDF